MVAVRYPSWWLGAGARNWTTSGGVEALVAIEAHGRDEELLARGHVDDREGLVHEGGGELRCLARAVGEGVRHLVDDRLAAGRPLRRVQV